MNRFAFRLKQLSYHHARRLMRRNGSSKSAPPDRSSVSARVSARVTRRLRVRPPVTHDLAQWSRDNGLDCVVLSSAATRERRAPIPLETAPHPNYERRRIGNIPERFLVCLPQGRVWGASGLVILPDESFADQAVYGWHLLEHDPGYFTPPPPRVTQKRGDYFTLLGKFSNPGNYYHWIHDALLRLHNVRPHLPLGVKYLVPSPLLDHQRETLHMLGLRDEEFVPFAGDSVWEFERLWFASLPPSGSEVPDAVSWLRDQLWAASGVDCAEPRRRFYLSRAETDHARVVNEQELAPVLERHGFEFVQPQHLSVKEQVRLFAQADVIVSPTSAAQANMLFASCDTRNVELQEPQWAENKAFVLWTLAETIGQPFYYLMADTVPNPEYPKRADLYVPPLKLERALERL